MSRGTAERRARVMVVYAYTEDDEEVVVREVGGEWFADCSCAWRSEPMGTRGAAEDVAEDHAIMHSVPRDLR